MGLNELTIKELSKLLDRKAVSSSDITNDCLGQIKKVEGKLNAFITITEKEAKKQAEKADKRIIKSKRLSKLDGIPVGIKDVFLTKDIKTTAASKMLENFIPAEDATPVKKLKEAGAVTLGKNNCDAWAHGSSTENSDFGVVHNPWDLKRVPGGSSGGSAASLVADECIASLGSDTGGSIRQPAAFCGAVGLKPTYGTVSRYGLIAMASSLDCPGPVTKTALDAKIFLETIAGKDEKDSTSVGWGSVISDERSGNLKDLKIGVPKEYFIKGLDKEVEENIKKAIKILEKQGVGVEQVSLPHTEYGIAAYYIIQPAEVSSNLGRYDGIKYGYSTKKARDLFEVYFNSRDEGFGDEAKRRIMLGTYTLSAGYYEAYYLKAQKVRTLIRKDFENAFKKVDTLITPTYPTTAFKIGEKTKDPLQMYLGDIFTVTMNLAGVPAVSLPCGFNKDKLPVGMQIIGNYFEEEKILSIAKLYEEATADEPWRNLRPKI